MTTEQRFLNDVATHEMHVLRDDGVYRHVRFKRPGTMCMHFDLITWPGYLCYTGDMGTYVFTRVSDMFSFFRKKPGTRIDFHYWAEKCEGSDKCDGLREFDLDAFKREITEQRRSLFVAYGRDMTADERNDFWKELEEVKNAAEDGEHRMYAAVQDWTFSFNKPDRWGQRRTTIDLDTSDFPSCKRYTHRFLWCCYALAWGIQQYDESKAVAEAV